MRKLCFSLALNLFVLGAVSAKPQPAPAPSYTVTEISVPGFANCQANSIDLLGDVCGLAWQPGGLTHAFVYRGGKAIDLGSLYDSTKATNAYFTNIEGEVVLTYQLPVNSNEYPVLYRNGRFTSLVVPGTTQTDVMALNDVGQIAGDLNINGLLSAFVIQPNGNMVMLSTSVGTILVAGITETGQVYGDVRSPSTGIVSAAITSVHGTPKIVGAIFDGGALGDRQIAVNNISDVVEVSQIVTTPGPWSSYLPVLTVGKKNFNLGPAPGAETLTGAAYFVSAINDFDTVIGYYSGFITPLPSDGVTNGYPTQRGNFVYLKGKMYDSNTLVSAVPGRVIGQLLGINDAGQILANGGDATGDHAYILTPRSR